MGFDDDIRCCTTIRPRKRPAFRLVDNRANRRRALRRSKSGVRSIRGLRSPSVSCRTNVRSRRLRLDGNSDVPCIQKVTLYRVLGLTEPSNRTFILDPQTGAIAHTAGATIVVYDSAKQTQAFFINRSRRTITCLAYAADGRHIASGERGHNPLVRVWDLNEGKEITELVGHRFSIDCVCFSPNLRYLVSIGSVHDMSINVWNWRLKTKLYTNNSSCQIMGIAFFEDGSSFVTVGSRHVKFWYLGANMSNKTTPLRGRSGILAEKKDNLFCDVACGRGDLAGRTFVITASSLLCEFCEDRLLEKWLDLKTEKSCCLSVGEALVVVGCGQGVVRVFDSDLRFIANLPAPTQQCITEHIQNARFADVVGVSLDEERAQIFTVYSDHSWYRWDVSDLHEVKQLDYAILHSDSVWSIAKPPSAEGIRCKGPGYFFTCSSDGSCRRWKVDETPHSLSQNLTSIICLENKLSDAQQDDSELKSKLCDENRGTYGARCLTIDPCGIHLAIGDRIGNVRIFELLTMKQIFIMEAHDSDVLCLAYSKWTNLVLPRLLASSGRDRLLHIFDCDRSYSLVYSIDDHSAAIPTVILSISGLLLSCGADKTILVRNLKTINGSEIKVFRQYQIVERHSILDMLIEEVRQIIISACQDRLIRIYNLADGKRLRSFRGSLSEEGSLVNIAMDNTGFLLAASCSNKVVYILNFDTTECLAVLSGHSEAVTDVQFSTDCSMLYTAAADSCVFVWTLNPILKSSLRSRNKMKPLKSLLTPPDLINSTDPRSHIRLNSVSYSRRTLWSLDNPNTVISCSPLGTKDSNIMSTPLDLPTEKSVEEEPLFVDENVQPDETLCNQSMQSSSEQYSFDGCDNADCTNVTSSADSPEMKKRHCDNIQEHSDSVIQQVEQSVKRFCQLFVQEHEKHEEIDADLNKRLETTLKSIRSQLSNLVLNQSEFHLDKISECLNALQSSPELYKTATSMLNSIVQSLYNLLPENK